MRWLFSKFRGGDGEGERGDEMARGSGGVAESTRGPPVLVVVLRLNTTTGEQSPGREGSKAVSLVLPLV